MNKKKIRRIVLISIVVFLILIEIAFRNGAFDGLVNQYNENKAQIAEQQVENSSSNTPSATQTQLNTTITPSSTVTDQSTVPTAKATPSGTVKNEYATNEKVAIIQSDKPQASDITETEIDDMVTRAIALSGGLDGIVKDGQTVVIKPNLVQMRVDSTGELFDKQDNGITTDWRVTAAVVRNVRLLNPHGKVYVMEGSATGRTLDVMEYLNYTHKMIKGVDEFIGIEEDTGGWQDFSSTNLVKVSLPDGLLHKSYYFNKKLYEADILISVPCLKSNSGAIVTAGIKNVSIGATPANIYGVSSTNHGRTKMVSHKIVDGDLDKWIYDYYICKPIDFVVVDGLEGFQNGPVPMGKGRDKSDKMNMRLVVAGKCAPSVDTICALIAGWDYRSIGYLSFFNQFKVGTTDTSKITVLGSPVDKVRKSFDVKLRSLGGVKVKDFSPPKFTFSITDKYNISINAEKKVNKIEIYIDNVMQQTVSKEENNSFSNIHIDILSLTKGNHILKLIAYDRFLNSSAQQHDISN